MPGGSTGASIPPPIGWKGDGEGEQRRSPLFSRLRPTSLLWRLVNLIPPYWRLAEGNGSPPPPPPPTLPPTHPIPSGPQPTTNNHQKCNDYHDHHTTALAIFSHLSIRLVHRCQQNCQSHQPKVTLPLEGDPSQGCDFFPNSVASINCTPEQARGPFESPAWNCAPRRLSCNSPNDCVAIPQQTHPPNLAQAYKPSRRES